MSSRLSQIKAAENYKRRHFQEVQIKYHQRKIRELRKKLKNDKPKGQK